MNFGVCAEKFAFIMSKRHLKDEKKGKMDSARWLWGDVQS